MGRLAYALALLAIAASAAVIATTSADLPPLVASHFAAGGAASGSMPRADYRVLMLTLSVVMPAAIILALAVLPRVAPRLVNVPNARAWFAPPHRAAFICAVHLLVVRANAVVPARLDADALGGVVGAFMLAIAAWAIALIVRFRKPPS